MNSTKRQARIAGSLYLSTSIVAVFGLLYVPSHFMVHGDAAATASKIVASEFLFRLGIVSELAGFTGFIFVVLALYHLLKGVDKTQALLMLTLMLVSIPISLVNVLNDVAALLIVRGAGFLSAFAKPQRDAIAMLLVQVHGSGFDIAEIFWGLWLIPFGILVFKSGFLPKTLGVLLMIACFGYLGDCLTSLLFPDYVSVVARFAGILRACELPTIFWLAIVGAKDQPFVNAA